MEHTPLASPETAQAVPRRSAALAAGLALVLLLATRSHSSGDTAAENRGSAHDAEAALASRASFEMSSPTASITMAPTALTHNEIINDLSSVGDSEAAVVQCTIASALCADAVCTLNSDKLTASCGCLSMPASATNPAELVLGWSTFQLAKSPVYQEALSQAASRGNITQDASDALCAAAESGQIWGVLSNAGELWADRISSTSLWSENNYQPGTGDGSQSSSSLN